MGIHELGIQIALLTEAEGYVSVTSGRLCHGITYMLEKNVAPHVLGVSYNLYKPY